MDTATAEALGREAVALGMPCWVGLAAASDMGACGRIGWIGCPSQSDGWAEIWPDFDDDLTALACIPWVRSVWTGDIAIEFARGAVYMSRHETDKNGYRRVPGNSTLLSAPTIAEVCIKMVRAAQEGG